MRLHARHLPALLGVLAVSCEVSAFFVGWIELNTGVSELLTWCVRLWLGGGIAAVIALPLGMAFDERGLTIPLVVLALLAAVPVGAFVFLARRH